MQTVDEPVLEFLRQHDLALRQLTHLAPQRSFTPESGLQFSDRGVRFLVQRRTAEQRQSVCGERALQPL